jgi:hypothetical protein
MGAGSRIQVEGDFTKAAVNLALLKLSERVDRLEGKTESTNRGEPLNISAGKGQNFSAGGFYVSRYGDDLEKSALSRGAHVDSAGQWVADSASATILEFTGDGKVYVYVNSGLTVGVPFSPTLDTTIT